MLRYHKKVYIKPGDIDKLKDFTAHVNTLTWKYTDHCIDNIKYRNINTENILRFIKNLKLEYDYIFEFYAEENTSNIIKVCYRIPYIKGTDIILVVGTNKQIITIYTNTVEDKHSTLRKEQYIKE